MKNIIKKTKTYTKKLYVNTYLLQDTSVGLVDLLNHPGHHGVYTISFHLFLRPNYCPHWEHMDCLV